MPSKQKMRKTFVHEIMEVFLFLQYLECLPHGKLTHKNLLPITAFIVISNCNQSQEKVVQCCLHLNQIGMTLQVQY